MRAQESIDSVDAEGAERAEGESEYLTTSEFILMNLSRHYALANYSMYKFENPDEAHNLFQVLIAYLMIGIPVGYMQIVIGQYTNLGIFHIEHMVPIAQGLGYALWLQTFLTTSLIVIIMTQYFVYTLLSIVNDDEFMPWLVCPKNYTDICFTGRNACRDAGPCITSTKHLSTYIYWNEIYMKGVASREEADVGMVPTYRIVAIGLIWGLVWFTLTFNSKRTYKVIKRAFIVLIVYKIVQFAIFLFWAQYMMYIQRLIHLNMKSFINLQAWKHAIRKVSIGMGLGDFSYIMFGMLSKRYRNTGSLIWFCGITSFFLAMMDHIILSGATYDLCAMANLPIEDRYLLFRPENTQLEFGVLPTVLGNLMSNILWNGMFYQHRSLILLFHIMLNHKFMILSLYQKFPVFKAYGVYIKPLFCVFGLCFGLLLDSKEAFPIRQDILKVMTEFCFQLNLLILTIIVCYVYGVSKFCDDVHFMIGEEPTKFWKIVWIMSPIILIISLPIDLFNESNRFAILRIITILVIYSPCLIFMIIVIVKKIRKKKLLSLLRATDEWGPLDPVMKLYRKSFNPRRDSKRQNESYKCVHKCLIDTKIPESEDDEEEEFLHPIHKDTFYDPPILISHV